MKFVFNNKHINLMILIINRVRVRLRVRVRVRVRFRDRVGWGCHNFPLLICGGVRLIIVGGQVRDLILIRWDKR
jgi:hypothetical protein